MRTATGCSLGDSQSGKRLGIGFLNHRKPHFVDRPGPSPHLGQQPRLGPEPPLPAGRHTVYGAVDSMPCPGPSG